MTTCEELKLILGINELENDKIEFKRKSILKDGPNLASGFVALANRHGGKFIIGVTNNGEFEAEYAYVVTKIQIIRFNAGLNKGARKIRLIDSELDQALINLKSICDPIPEIIGNTQKKSDISNHF